MFNKYYNSANKFLGEKCSVATVVHVRTIGRLDRINIQSIPDNIIWDRKLKNFINASVYENSQNCDFRNVNTLKPLLSGHYRPEGASNWEFAQISELQ